MTADDLAAAGAVEAAGLRNIAGNVSKFGLETGGRELLLHSLAPTLFHRVGVEQQPVRLQDSRRLAEETRAGAIIVRSFDVEHDVESRVGEGQVERAP